MPFVRTHFAILVTGYQAFRNTWCSQSFRHCCNISFKLEETKIKMVLDTAADYSLKDQIVVVTGGGSGTAVSYLPFEILFPSAPTEKKSRDMSFLRTDCALSRSEDHDWRPKTHA
jgi:hypothetical protein